MGILNKNEPAAYFGLRLPKISKNVLGDFLVTTDFLLLNTVLFLQIFRSSRPRPRVPYLLAFDHQHHHIAQAQTQAHYGSLLTITLQ